mmetsp:Transcript_63515/g.73864  ORF Transcript_63515/g.73864 Transcript_63515/m.73864 type:complete len:233 (+) Transcript_63515:85-783(+)
MMSDTCHSPRLVSKLRPEVAARLRQLPPPTATGLPTAPSGGQAGRKRIVFSRLGPRVSFIEAQSKEEHPNLWFTETERVVTKPLSFCISPNDKVSIEIDTQVQITGIAATSSSSLSLNSSRGMHPTTGKRPRQNTNGCGMTTLEICDNRDGSVADSMDDRLAKLRQRGERTSTNPTRLASSPAFFAVASVRPDDGISRVGLVMPAGAYVLHCHGDAELMVFGQAADVERCLA